MLKLFTNTARLYYRVPGFPLLQTEKGEEEEEEAAEEEEEDRTEGRETANIRLKEEEEEEKRRETGSVDLRLHYSTLTLLIADHDAAL